MEKLERWKNNTQSQIWVDKIDPMTKEKQSTQIMPGTIVEISSEERQSNQVRTVDKKLDWFSNGSLSPVELVEDATDYAAITENSNTLSESEVFDLLDLKAPELKKRLADIDSIFILSKLNDYLESDEGKDDDRITLPKAKAIEARYSDLTPNKIGQKVSLTIEESTTKDKSIQPV